MKANKLIYLHIFLLGYLYHRLGSYSLFYISYGKNYSQYYLLSHKFYLLLCKLFSGSS